MLSLTLACSRSCTCLSVLSSSRRLKFSEKSERKSIEKMKNIVISPSVEEELHYMIIHICCTLTWQRTDDFDLMNFSEEMSNEVSDR